MKNPPSQKFIIPFSAINNSGFHSLEKILFPTILPNRSTLASKEAGDFPNNIREFIFGKGGEINGDEWVLFCKLDNGNYALLVAWCGDNGFNHWDSGMILNVGEKHTLISSMNMNESIYDAYNNLF